MARRARRKGESKPGPKKKPRPKKKPKGRSPIQGEEAEAMFQAYRENPRGGYSAVARAFKRDPRTVKRIATDNGWDERIARIEAKAAQKADQQAAKNQLGNIQILRSVKNLALKKILERDATGKVVSLNVPVKVRDLATLIELEEELTGGLTGADEGASIVDRETALEAINMIKSIGPTALRKLGDMIAKNHPDIAINTNETED